MENTLLDLRILEKGCYYKVLNSQQYKEEADGNVFDENHENTIDKTSDFIYIKILTVSISKKEDIQKAEKIGDLIPFTYVDSNAEYLDNEEFCIDYDIEIWGDFDNSCFDGALAETGEYEKVTDLSFLEKLEKFNNENVIKYVGRFQLLNDHKAFDLFECGCGYKTAVEAGRFLTYNIYCNHCEEFYSYDLNEQKINEK